MLDEPASGLTHSEVDELGELVKQLRDDFNLTILLVEHHMAMVMGISDHVVVLDFGRRIAEGAPQDGRHGPAGDRGLPGRVEVTVSDHRLVRAPATSPADALLRVSGLRASYGQIEVLHGVDFDVNAGEVVVILGANGAGKTTTLRAICQMVSTKGQIDARRLEHRRQVDHRDRAAGRGPRAAGPWHVRRAVRGGQPARRCLRPQGQADPRRHRQVVRRCSPACASGAPQLAGSLSGGEQQMLAVARALMSRPKLLLLDEPSLGLAPIIVQDLFHRFDEMNKTEGITMLIVEQNANLALDIADRAYVLEAGEIVLSGTADELRHDEGVRKAYLGY